VHAKFCETLRLILGCSTLSRSHSLPQHVSVLFHLWTNADGIGVTAAPKIAETYASSFPQILLNTKPR